MESLLGLLILISQTEEFVQKKTDIHVETLISRARFELSTKKPDQALKTLEEAYDHAQNVEQLKEIALIIITASDKKYPRRENILKYLVEHAKNNENYFSWLEELADRAALTGDHSQAIDYLIQSRPISKNTALIDFKLGQSHLHQKNLGEAMRLWLAAHASGDRVLQVKIEEALPALWWEMGFVPQSLWSVMVNWSEPILTTMIRSLLEDNQFKTKPQALHREIFRQILEDPKTSSILKKVISEGFYFKKDPCFFFRGILHSQDAFPMNSFLECLKYPDHPPSVELMPYFSALKERREERVDRAEAELWIEEKQSIRGLRIMMKPSLLGERSKDFLQFIEKTLLELSDEDFKIALLEIPVEHFESFLKIKKSEALLKKLQQNDPSRWIEYEERLFAGKEVPKEFLFKKARFLVNQSPLPLSVLKDLVQKIYQLKVGPSERKLRFLMELLERRLTTELPKTYSKEFFKKQNLWLSDVDNLQKHLLTMGSDWQTLMGPIVRELVQKNIDAIAAQILDLGLEEEWSEFQMTFDEKKQELVRELRSKYR